MKRTDAATLVRVIGKVLRTQLEKRDERLNALRAEIESLRKRLESIERER